jgi:hypothetical protein
MSAMSKQTFPDDGVSEGVLSELGILLIIQFFKRVRMERCVCLNGIVGIWRLIEDVILLEIHSSIAPIQGSRCISNDGEEVSLGKSWTAATILKFLWSFGIEFGKGLEQVSPP